MYKNGKYFSYKIEPHEEENYKLKKSKNKKKIKKKAHSFIKLKNLLSINKIKKQNIICNCKNILILLIISFAIFLFLLYSLIIIIVRKDKLVKDSKKPEFLIKEINENPLIIKEKNEELKRVEDFIENNINNNFITSFSKKQNKPKISIIISVYNDAKFLKSSLISIQKQDFEDLEIIIVDDCSTDDSITIINGLMNQDSRIVLIKNEENKGLLFTKTKGILNAKGKYVMILENKDIYLQKNAFSTLYNEAEKDDLDILGFSAIINWQEKEKINYSVKGKYIHHFFETPIIVQPNITQKMYYNDSDGKIHREGDVIFNYIFRTDLFNKIILQIDDKYLRRKMYDLEDLLLFFLLTRKASTLKYIKKIFYFSLKNKMNLNSNLTCLDSLYYSEFLLNKTNNTDMDKKIASYELETWYLNNSCRSNELTRSEAINITKLFSENKYIKDETKKNIYLFMFENVTTISN